MIDHDAARLAEIRTDANNYNSSRHQLAGHVLELLGKLAAARPHDASFVSRATYETQRDNSQAVIERWILRVTALEAACARHVTAYDEVARRVAKLEATIDNPPLDAMADAYSVANGVDMGSHRYVRAGMWYAMRLFRSLAFRTMENSAETAAALRPAEEKPR